MFPTLSTLSRNSVAQSLPDVSGKVGGGGSDGGTVIGSCYGCFTKNNLAGGTSVAARANGYTGGLICPCLQLVTFTKKIAMLFLIL